MTEDEIQSDYGLILTSCVTQANAVLTEYGLAPIDSASIEIVDFEKYKRIVCATADKYQEAEVSKEALTSLANRSAAIVLHNATSVLYSSDAIQVMKNREVDPQNIVLAGSFAHEDYHLKAMANRKNISDSKTVPVYGQHYSYYVGRYGEVAYTLIGPGLKVTAGGVIVAEQIRLNEFMADLQRYLVVNRFFDTNDLITNIVAYHRASKKILPCALESDARISHLCAILCVYFMDNRELATAIRLSYQDPEKFLANNLFGSIITNHFAHGNDANEALLEIFRRSGQKRIKISDFNLQYIGYSVFNNEFKKWLEDKL